jgi:hypothetical protein
MHQEVISLNNMMGEVRILMEPGIMKEMKSIEDVEVRYQIISESVKDSLLNLLTYSTKNIESIEEALDYLRNNVASLQYKAGCFVGIYEHSDMKHNSEAMRECKIEFEQVIHACKDQLERLKRNHQQLEANSLNDLDNIEIKIEMLEELHNELRHKNGEIYSEQDIKDKIEITQSKLYEKVMNLSQDIFDIEMKLRNCVEVLSKQSGLGLMIRGSEFLNEDNAMVINLRDAPPDRNIQIGSGYIMQKEEDD